MNTELSEKRVHTRSQFFLLKADGENVSLFAFRPEDAIHAIPALVVDLSDGGVQIISATNMPLVQSDYLLELAPQDSAPSEKVPVHLVWSRQDGINTKSGFAFGSNPLPSTHIAAQLEESEHRILRCVLHPQ